MENHTSEDREPGTTDREELLSHDAENAGDEQGDGNFQEHWDELVRTYLRALEKAEEKLQSNQ